jgi:photosystem II stability/assembly factor-like uncharacterized protein/Flp pilus assembly pilin Flp
MCEVMCMGRRLCKFPETSVVLEREREREREREQSSLMGMSMRCNLGSKGASIIEYAIILGLLAMAVASFVKMPICSIYSKVADAFLGETSVEVPSETSVEPEKPDGTEGGADESGNSTPEEEKEYYGDEGCKANWINGMVYVNGKYFAVGSGGYIFTSDDGVAWECSGKKTEEGSWLEKIIYADGKYIAVGNKGTIICSTDGETWTQVTAGVVGNEQLYDIAYGDGLFVAVGLSGGIYYSQDGVTWNDGGKSPPACRGIIYDGSRFIIATGSNGKLLVGTVDNGAFELGEDIGGSHSGQFRGITYNNGIYVAVGADGVIYTSSDGGGTWIQGTGNIPKAYLNSVAYGNGLFVAVGNGNTIVVSKDNGSTWEILSESDVSIKVDKGGTQYNNVMFQDGKFIIVGNNTAIYEPSTSGENEE